MCSKIIIETVANGFIVTDNKDEIDNRIVFSFDNGIKESVVDLLNHVKALLGYSGSKHDAQRIFIQLEDHNGS